MTILGLLLATIAFALFGIATDAHHRGFFGARADRTKARRMRGAGWVLLAAAIPAAIAAQGWIYGPVLWFATLMLGAGIVFLALNLFPASIVSNGRGGEKS
jgi:predicted aminopeptidase